MRAIASDDRGLHMSDTARLRMEALGVHHAAILFPCLQDERIYTYITEARPLTVEDLEARHVQLVKGPADRKHEAWLNWVMFRSGTDVPVGTLQATLPGTSPRAYVAYILFPEFWGRGFATEGVTWMIDVLGARGIFDLEAHVDVRNTRSAAVMGRTGFNRVRSMPTDFGLDDVFVRSC